jgi:uncharacterized protein
LAQRIEQDARRFREIVHGRIKRELRQYMTRGELIARKGQEQVSIPLPHIELPRFRYGSQSDPGVGHGEGEVGEPVAGADGASEAGDQAGEHILEVDVELSELAKVLQDALELPRILPKGKRALSTQRARYSSLRRTGPESLKQFKRGYVNALKRMIASGDYDADDPVIVPERADRRYRSWKSHPKPESNAVIIYMMDVSGSMGSEQKEIVRIESFWIDTWLRSQYAALESVYITHDAVAREVDQHTFFHARESGGTKISSAYKLCLEVIRQRYPSELWNIYPFHFSDGDNWCSDDTRVCLDLLRDKLLRDCNMFCYGQVKSAYGSGQFISSLEQAFGADERVILSEIADREQIYDSIKTFLGKGR